MEEDNAPYGIHFSDKFHFVVDVLAGVHCDDTFAALHECASKLQIDEHDRSPELMQKCKKEVNAFEACKANADLDKIMETLSTQPACKSQRKILEQCVIENGNNMTSCGEPWQDLVECGAQSLYNKMIKMAEQDEEISQKNNEKYGERKFKYL